jgi:DNA modification methylase
MSGGLRWSNNQSSLRTTELKPKDLVGIPWRVAFALQSDGWYLRSDIIWHKPNAMPESVKDRPTKAHEYLFLLTKSDKYYYDGDSIKEQATYEVKRIGRIGKYQDRAMFGKGDGTSPKAIAARDLSMRNRRTVWSITTKPFKGAHFAVFPPDLITPCILAGSRPGDMILDPFAGAGTTLLVAEKLGRNSIGIELNPTYCDLITSRLQVACS